MASYIDELRQLVVEDELEEVLDKLLDCLRDKHTRLYEEALHHKSSLNGSNRNLRKQTVSNSYAERTRARIKDATLYLLREMDKKNIVCVEEENHGDSGSENESATKMKILFVSSSPDNLAKNRIDAEIREIDSGLRAAKNRDSISLAQRWAVTPQILQQSLLDENPTIVHFSGHGSEEGIMLEDEFGNYLEVPATALERLFSLFSDSIECVVLNACYSRFQAEAIAKHIPYVIGMNDAIPNDAAKAFSVGFYQALGNGRDVKFAFGYGVSLIQLQSVGEIDIPFFFGRNVS